MEKSSFFCRLAQCINRGGLFCISDITFDFFVSLEYEVRAHIHAGQKLGVVSSTLQQSEDVLLKLMDVIIKLWITFRGFSLASAWIEQYK